MYNLFWSSGQVTGYTNFAGSQWPMLLWGIDGEYCVCTSNYQYYLKINPLWVSL